MLSELLAGDRRVSSIQHRFIEIGLSVMKNEGLLLLKAEKINLIYQNWMKYFWILPIDGQPEPGEIGQYYKWNCEILLLQESLLYVQLKKTLQPFETLGELLSQILVIVQNNIDWITPCFQARYLWHLTQEAYPAAWHRHPPLSSVF